MQRKKSITEGIIGGICFSTASIFIRLLNMNALSIIFWRMILGGLILLILLKPSLNLVKEYGIISIILGSFLFLHFYFFVKSVQDTYILNSTILVNTAPIISIVIVAILQTEKLDLKDIASVALGFLGVTVMIVGKGSVKFGVFGDFEALVAAFMISIYAIFARSKIRKIERSFILSGLIYLVAGVEATSICLLTGGIQIPMSSLDIFYILGLAFIPTALGHSLYLKSLKGLSPHETQILALLEPVGATILAFFLIREAPPSASIIGSIIIALSIFLIAKKED